MKLYSSHPCGDSIKVYSGMNDTSILVQNICSFSSSTFEGKMSTRNAYIRFQTDGRRGRGTGFRGTFIAQGEHVSVVLQPDSLHNNIIMVIKT